MRLSKLIAKQLTTVSLAACIAFQPIGLSLGQEAKPFLDQNLSEQFSESLSILETDLGDLKASDWGALGEYFNAKKTSLFSEHNKILVGQLRRNLGEDLAQIDRYDEQMQRFIDACKNEHYDEIWQKRAETVLKIAAYITNVRPELDKFYDEASYVWERRTVELTSRIKANFGVLEEEKSGNTEQTKAITAAFKDARNKAFSNYQGDLDHVTWVISTDKAALNRFFDEVTDTLLTGMLPPEGFDPALCEEEGDYCPIDYVVNAKNLANQVRDLLKKSSFLRGHEFGSEAQQRFQDERRSTLLHTSTNILNLIRKLGGDSDDIAKQILNMTEAEQKRVLRYLDEMAEKAELQRWLFEQENREFESNAERAKAVRQSINKAAFEEMLALDKNVPFYQKGFVVNKNESGEDIAEVKKVFNQTSVETERELLTSGNMIKHLLEEGEDYSDLNKRIRKQIPETIKALQEREYQELVSKLNKVAETERLKQPENRGEPTVFIQGGIESESGPSSAEPEVVLSAEEMEKKVYNELVELRKNDTSWAEKSPEEMNQILNKEVADRLAKQNRSQNRRQNENQNQNLAPDETVDLEAQVEEMFDSQNPSDEIDEELLKAEREALFGPVDDAAVDDTIAEFGKAEPIQPLSLEPSDKTQAEQAGSEFKEVPGESTYDRIERIQQDKNLSETAREELLKAERDAALARIDETVAERNLASAERDAIRQNIENIINDESLSEDERERLLKAERDAAFARMDAAIAKRRQKEEKTRTAEANQDSGLSEAEFREGFDQARADDVTSILDEAPGGDPNLPEPDQNIKELQQQLSDEFDNDDLFASYDADFEKILNESTQLLGDQITNVSFGFADDMQGIANIKPTEIPFEAGGGQCKISDEVAVYSPTSANFQSIITACTGTYVYESQSPEAFKQQGFEQDFEFYNAGNGENINLPDNENISISLCSNGYGGDFIRDENDRIIAFSWSAVVGAAMAAGEQGKAIFSEKDSQEAEKGFEQLLNDFANFGLSFDGGGQNIGNGGMPAAPTIDDGPTFAPPMLNDFQPDQTIGNGGGNNFGGGGQTIGRR